MRDLKHLLPKDSWFREWLELWPTIESPETYQLFAGMSAMGAALGRRLWFDNDVFRVYPMLNLLLIGPSGIGKSTVMTYLAGALFKALPFDHRPTIISSGTKEKIHLDLSATPKAVVMASELANFFNKSKYMEGTIPYFTQLLDYEDQVELRTKGSGIVVITNPSVTVMGASTVEWLQDQLPDSAGTGGFLARFLIIAEEYKGKRVPLPGLALEVRERTTLDLRRAKVINDFVRLVDSAPAGPIPLESYDVADTFAYWYMNQKPEIGYLAPFVERSREIVLRLSTLLALSCGRSVIKNEDVSSAIALYHAATIRLKTVVVPMSVDGKLLLAVLRTLGRGSMTREELYSAMSSIATDKRIDLLVDSHLRSGALTLVDGKLKRSKVGVLKG